MAVNEELVAKLQSEISMEEGMQEDEDLSANIKEYLENSPFEVSTFAISHLHNGMLTHWHRSKTSLVTRK